MNADDSKLVELARRRALEHLRSESRSKYYLFLVVGILCVIAFLAGGVLVVVLHILHCVFPAPVLN